MASGGMVSQGITIKFSADLSGLTDGVKSITSMFSDLTASAKEWSGSFSDAFNEAFSGLSNIATPDLSNLGVGEVAEELTELASSASEAVESLTSLGSETEDAGQESLSFIGSLNLISSSLVALGSNIGGVVSGRLAILGTGIQQIGTNISNVATGAFNGFISRIQDLGASINNITSGPIDSFVSRVQNLASTVSDMASSAFDNFVSRVQDLGSSINDAVSGPLDAFSNGVQNVASIISDAASGAMDNLVSRVQQVGSSINDVVGGPINSLVSGVQQIGSNISDAVSGPLNAFTDGVQRVGSTIGNAVSGPFNSFISSIQSFGADISSAATGPLGDLISGLQSLGSNINEVVSGGLNNFTDSMRNAASSMSDMVQQTITGTGSFSDFKQGIVDAFSGVSNFVGGIGDAAGGVMDFVNNVGMSIMSLQMIGQQAISTAQDLLGPAVSAETMKTAFVTLMGSTQSATDELNKLDTFASHTPFKTMDIDQAASQLIGFGVSASDTIPDLTAIGDALSAVGKGSTANLDGVVNIFGKIQTSGGLTVGTMQQLSRYGINAWQVLEQQTGKTKDQLTTMIQQGLLPAKDAMGLLTKGIEGNPLYAGGMAKQSATMAGLLSTLQSNWDQLMVSFGTPIIQALEGSLSTIGNDLTSPGFKDFAGSVGQGIANAFKNIGTYLQSADFKTFVSNMQSLGTQISPIIADLKPVATSIFSSIGPALKTGATDVGNFAKGVGDVIKFFKDGSAPAQVLSVAILGVAAGMTAMKISQFVETIPKLLTGLQLWAAGQWEVAVPTLITMGLFILIGIAVVGAIALIILAVKNWGAIVKWLQGVWAAIAGFFGWLWGQISGFFVGVGKWFADRFTEAYHGILGAIGGIGAWFQGIWKDIQGAFGAVGNWFHNLWQGVCDDFTSVLGGLGKLAGTIWNGVTGAIKSGFNWVIDLINGVIKNIDNIKVAGFGVSIPLIPHLASGISNFMGGIALVGEQGPELVGLPKGSSVFNASNTSNFLKDIGNFKSSAISGAIASPSAVNYAAMAGGQAMQAAASRQTIIVQAPDIYLDSRKMTKSITNTQMNMTRIQGGLRRQ